MAELYQTATRCLSIDARHPDMTILEDAAATIRRGGLVAFPTETVYGLGANALDAAAVQRIFLAKQRPTSDPLIVHLACIDQVAQVADDIPPLAYALLRRFAPGPLTLALKKHNRVPANLTAGMHTVALRLPSHPVASALIEAAATPIAAPSANRFSRPSPTTARHVLDDLDGRVDLILDAGATDIGLESTIVSLVGEQPRVLRAGGISLEALRQAVPDLAYAPPYLAADVESAPAPGSMLKHYSPRARLLLFNGERRAALKAMREAIQTLDGCGLLALEADLAYFADLDLPAENLGHDHEMAAARLFSALRRLDSRGVTHIAARMPEATGLGLAIGDRLLRAAAGELIKV